MYKRVLIAEDQDAAHHGIAYIVERIVPEVDKVKYCDDALLKIRASINTNTPYDVLITDLNFDEAHRERTVTIGEDLIAAARQLIPALKVVVYSVEKGVARVQKLYENYHINAFIEKGRDTTLHIKKALEAIEQGQTYCTPTMNQLLRSSSEINELEEKDIKLAQPIVKWS